ncbi:hypothetical protein KIPB_014872, partial [Kipferlia bialata]|eukprot:g14872.t1
MVVLLSLVLVAVLTRRYAAGLLLSLLSGPSPVPGDAVVSDAVDPTPSVSEGYARAEGSDPTPSTVSTDTVTQVVAEPAVVEEVVESEAEGEGEGEVDAPVTEDEHASTLPESVAETVWSAVVIDVDTLTDEGDIDDSHIPELYPDL